MVDLDQTERVDRELNVVKRARFNQTHKQTRFPKQSLVFNHIRLKSCLRYLQGNVNKTTCHYINKFNFNNLSDGPLSSPNLCGLLILWRQGCESTLNFAKNWQNFWAQNWHLRSCWVHYSAALFRDSDFRLICFDAVFDQHKLGRPPAVGGPFRSSLKSRSKKQIQEDQK